MTLIGVAVSRDSAEIATDTLCYQLNLAAVSEMDKQLILDHVPVVVVRYAQNLFHDLWWPRAGELSLQASTFDEFTRLAEPELRPIHQVLTDYFGKEHGIAATDSTLTAGVVHVGYSHQHQRFKAYGYLSDLGFKRIDLKQPLFVPAHFGLRPSVFERALKDATRGDPRVVGRDQYDERLPEWMRQARFTRPESVDEWIDVACRARDDRVVPGGGITHLVGGQLRLTTLTREGTRSSIIHTFDQDVDDPTHEGFRRCLLEHDHPLAQLSPCPYCDSGRRLVDCCLDADAPCSCGWGNRFADCCSVYAPHRGASTPQIRPPAPDTRQRATL
ncbi:MAG: hypothetical protein KG028_00075 [Actinobacteria bacterium]|jgi:hypothetical protein|nr:hypothetical protein [Actinomycetota bacterium]